IGRATPRGVLKVTPKATTTYTLTVTGVNGTLTKTVTVNVAGTTPIAATTSVPLNQQPAPRTADGKPDLTGVYGYAAGPARGTPPPPAAPGARQPDPPPHQPHQGRCRARQHSSPAPRSTKWIAARTIPACTRHAHRQA